MIKKVLLAICALRLILIVGGCTYNKNNYWNETKIEFVGQEKRDDNPWGISAGIVSDSNYSDMIFLTPDTSCSITCDSSFLNNLSLFAGIYSAVSNYSDGLQLVAYIYNEEEVLFEKEFYITNEKKWVLMDLPSDLNFSKIEFKCLSGNNNDSTCDWLVIRSSLKNNKEFGYDGYVRSATYFGDEWPINFWNSEFSRDKVGKDFLQIKNDGFNSIIVVIPWKEFQTSINPITYNDYTFTNLELIMEVANKYGLGVYTRIGYTWDYYNDEDDDIHLRYLDLLRNKDVYAAWLDYCKTLYQTLSKHSNFKKGFLTWEDFWGVFTICDIQDYNTRLQYASDIRYYEWVKNHYTLEEYNNKYNLSYSTLENIPVPLRDEPAMEDFYAFYDSFLNTILVDSQTCFKDLSIEVRIDADIVTKEDGSIGYYSHEKTYSCGNSDYTATMYGIPMGYENNGERVDADDAIKHTEWILNQLKEKNDGKPVYVEQFIFYDNTPKFINNARLKDSELESYLENVSSVLLNYTNGYGIWTYRNYKNNMLYNPQFGLGEQGWQVMGNENVSFSYFNNLTWACKLNKGSSIFQHLPSVRDHFPNDTFIFEFDVLEGFDSVLEIKIGDNVKKITVDKTGHFSFSIEQQEMYDVCISVEEGSVVIDNICLYSFIQEGMLYDESNNEKPIMKSIRLLNDELEREY